MPREKVLNTLNSKPIEISPPRGEVWINPEVLTSQGLPNSEEGIIKLTRSIGADLCFFSCGGPQPIDVKSVALKKAVGLARSYDLACGAVIDGPWQRQTHQNGLLPMIQQVITDLSGLQKSLAKQANRVREELAAWSEAGADLILLADDIAYSEGPYFSPSHFGQLLLPFYRSILENNFGPPIGFHSDGNIELLLPSLVKAGMGFFSLEPEEMNIPQIWRLHGRRATVLSGIKAAWLAGAPPAGKPEQAYPADLTRLLGQGNLILASTCGLFHPLSVNAIKKIYEIVDNACHPTS